MTIIVRDVEPRIFHLLLTCIYTDTAEVEVKNVGEAMAVATKYAVDKLHGVCASFLEDGIRIDNAAQLFQTAPQLVCYVMFMFMFCRRRWWLVGWLVVCSCFVLPFQRANTDSVVFCVFLFFCACCLTSPPQQQQQQTTTTTTNSWVTVNSV